MDVDKLLKDAQWIDGDFSNLKGFNFYGVYVIYDENNNNEVVYVGSAYARTVEERLKQYISEKDTGNTLMHAICIKDMEVDSVKEIKDENKENTIKQIKGYKIKAMRHEDLEYKLIREATPKYNTAGKGKLKSTKDTQKK